MGNEKNNVVPETTPSTEVSTNLETQNKEIATSSINNDKKKKTSKWAVIAICISLVFLVFYCCISFAIHNNELKKEEEIKRKETALKNQQEIIDGYGQALEIIIDNYYKEHNELLSIEDAISYVDIDKRIDCQFIGINEDRTVYLHECRINGIDTKCNYGELKKHVYNKDTSFIVFVDKKNDVVSLNRNKNNLREYIVETNQKYKNVILLSENSSLPFVRWEDENNKGHLTNYVTGKKALENIDYNEIKPIYEKDHFTEYAVVTDNNHKSDIYNFVTGAKITNSSYDYATNHKYNVDDPKIPVTTIGNTKGIVFVKDTKTYVIDYTNGNALFSGNYSNFKQINNYIFVQNSDNHKSLGVFDYNLNPVSMDQYDYILGVADDNYMLVEKDNHIKLVNFSNDLIYDFGVDKYEISRGSFGSKYMDGVLFNLIKNDNKCIEFNYSEKNGGSIKELSCGGLAKPILYLYPKKTTKVTVNFEHPEYLKTTYPKFENQWTVKAKSNGDLYDKNGRYYYGLYWDENRIHTVDFSEGFYVEDKDAINFLEKKLDYISLSEREANEFITYWLPILENNKKNLVYFELTDERESYNKININPKPDSLLRIVIHIKKVDKKTNIKEEKLTQFKRNGFTAVEWGGTTY